MTVLTPIKSIRVKCLDCMAGSFLEVKCCSALNCPLWYHRLGIRPSPKNLRQNPYLSKEFFEKIQRMSASQIDVFIRARGTDN